MAKKLMQDMKSKGVKITRILKENKEDTKIEKLYKVESNSLVNKTQEAKIPDHLYTRELGDRIYSTPQQKNKSGALRKSLLWILILSILLGGGYYLANLFQKVNIYVVAKNQTFDLNHTQFVGSNTLNSPLHFELMIVSSEDYKDITLTESENISSKAKGVITFFNEYSTKSQTLAIHTFVSDNNGKTYQTDKAVTIPGYKTVNSKVVPGQASVGITAFLPGKEYNGSPASFAVNSFKGTAKSSKIYAKLKTALEGGAQGVVYNLGPSEKGLVSATAESSFKSNLIKKVNAEVPPGYILYPDAQIFTYKTEADSLFDSSNAKVKITGTISSIILNQKDLSNALIKNLLPDITERELNEISIPDISSLKFSFVKQDQSITKDIKIINFSLTGKIKGIWSPNLPLLQSNVLGIKKSDLVSVFKTDPGIVSASARIFPPWQSYLPKDLSKIYIYIQ